MLSRNIICQKILSVDVGCFLVDDGYGFLVIVSQSMSISDFFLPKLIRAIFWLLSCSAIFLLMSIVMVFGQY